MIRMTVWNLLSYPRPIYLFCLKPRLFMPTWGVLGSPLVSMWSGVIAGVKISVMSTLLIAVIIIAVTSLGSGWVRAWSVPGFWLHDERIVFSRTRWILVEIRVFIKIPIITWIRWLICRFRSYIFMFILRIDVFCLRFQVFIPFSAK